MSSIVIISNVGQASRQNRCAWSRQENQPCSTEVVADFTIQISDGPEDVYGVTEIPLCLEHARDKVFLTWLTHLAHDIVLKTVKTLRHQSLGDIRFTYRLVARGPRTDILTGESPVDAFRSPSIPPDRLPDEIVVAASSPDRPYTKTYVVPHRPKEVAQMRYLGVVKRARRAWYSLTEDEKLLYNRVASSKGLPGIYLFVSRFIRAEHGGNGRGSLLYPEEKLLD